MLRPNVKRGHVWRLVGTPPLSKWNDWPSLVHGQVWRQESPHFLTKSSDWANVISKCSGWPNVVNGTGVKVGRSICMIPTPTPCTHLIQLLIQLNWSFTTSFNLHFFQTWYLKEINFLKEDIVSEWTFSPTVQCTAHIGWPKETKSCNRYWPKLNNRLTSVSNQTHQTFSEAAQTFNEATQTFNEATQTFDEATWTFCEATCLAKKLTQLLPHCQSETDRIDSTPRQSKADRSHFSDASLLKNSALQFSADGKPQECLKSDECFLKWN